MIHGPALSDLQRTPSSGTTVIVMRLVQAQRRSLTPFSASAWTPLQTAVTICYRSDRNIYLTDLLLQEPRSYNRIEQEQESLMSLAKLLFWVT